MAYNITFVKPDYFDKFQCIGGACRHNCCHYNWRIDIDKQTCKAYKNYRGSPELEEKFKKYIKMNNFAPNDARYAELVQLQNPTKCAFEREDGLCHIHAEMGSQALSHTCKTFPRYYSSVYPSDHQATNCIFINEHLCFGCEVVIEHFLNSSEPISLETADSTLSVNQLNALGISNSSSFHAIKRPIVDNYYLIESVSIAILQNRKLCFEDRLILLGLFCSRLEKLENENASQETITSEIKVFIDSIDEEYISKKFSTVLHSTEKHINLILEIIFQFFYKDASDLTSLVVKVRQNFAGSSKIEHNDKVNISKPVYEAYLKNYNNFMKDKQPFIENIFVNTLFTNHIPICERLSVYESFQSMIILYMSFRFLIMYTLGDNTYMTEDELIEMMVFWGRSVGNPQKEMIKVMVDVINKNHTLSLTEMIEYIK